HKTSVTLTLHWGLVTVLTGTYFVLSNLAISSQGLRGRKHEEGCAVGISNAAAGSRGTARQRTDSVGYRRDPGDLPCGVRAKAERLGLVLLWIHRQSSGAPKPFRHRRPRLAVLDRVC